MSMATLKKSDLKQITKNQIDERVLEINKQLMKLYVNINSLNQRIPIN